MNILKRLINFHVAWLNPAIFGEVLGGLFGGDAPDFPSLSQMMPTNVGTQGGLFNTQFAFDPNNKTGTANVSLTGAGQNIADTYLGLFTDAQDAYQNFNVQDFANERQRMMNNILGTERLASQNRLFDRVAGMTGGLTATSGGRDLLSRGAAQADLNAQRVALSNLDRAYQREGLLYGRQQPALSGYTNFMLNAENAAQRDVTPFMSLSNMTSQNAMGRYQADYADYQADQAFWSALGAPLDMALGMGIGNVMGGASFFGGGGITGSTAPVGGSSANWAV